MDQIVRIFIFLLATECIIIGTAGNSPLPSLKEEAIHFLKLFGYSDSCTSSALEWCDHGCKSDFPAAISQSKKAVAEAALTLEKALKDLQSLSDCFEKGLNEPLETLNLNEPNKIVESENFNNKPKLDAYDESEVTEITKNHEKKEDVSEKINTLYETYLFDQNETYNYDDFFEDKFIEESEVTTTTQEPNQPSSCAEFDGTAIQSIYPYLCCSTEVSVYCEDGGWTVIQRRLELPVRENFYRNWTDYANGFGNLTGEFWLGLNIIHDMTLSSRMVLRIELENEQGEKRFAEYDDFKVGSASQKFELLSIGLYTGDAGDSLSAHKGRKFTTRDSDNDGHPETNCAVAYKGAWWYNACHTSNLNGYQYVGETVSYADGIVWEEWMGFLYSLSKVTMMIRPYKS